MLTAAARSMRDARPCPACQRAYKRDCLDACVACGLETLNELPSPSWSPSCRAAGVLPLGVAVAHDPPKRGDNLYRDAPPQADLRAFITSEQGWTLLIPMVMFGGPFVMIGAIGLVSCAGLFAMEVVRGSVLMALTYALCAVFSLAGLAAGVAGIYTLASMATRRTAVEFSGSTLRIEEKRFLFWRRVTTLDRVRVTGVRLAGYQRDTTRVLLLLRDGGAICVTTSPIAADAESLAISLARAFEAPAAGGPLG